MTSQNVAPATFQAFNADTLFAELESTPGDTFDLVVNAGIMARESLDQGRYIIGDCAVHLHKRYGEDIVGQFAEQINCRTASVREYRRVCTFWQRSTRAELFAEMPGLAYSMLRDSVRFKSPALALDFLRRCVDNDWKCERAHIECNRALGSEAPEMFKVLDTVLNAQEVMALGLEMEVAYSGTFRLVVYQFSEESVK